MAGTNTIVTQSFTYKIPNSIGSQDDSEGKTVTATYTGPDKVWAFVDTDGPKVGSLSRCMGDFTEKDDGGICPVPAGTTRVLLTPANDALIIAILSTDGMSIEYPGQGVNSETLPGGAVWKTNTKPNVDESYADQSHLRYDLDNEVWLTPPYEPVPCTWAEVIQSRNMMLEASDSKISPDMPDSVSAPWVAYRTALRNLPATFKYGESDEIAPWKVTIPLAPDTVTE
jgi:hypothetical protein